VDNCIRHFGDWWLVGYKYYGSWGWDMWDLCDQFVVAAVTGGLVTFVVYIMIFKRSFGAIGIARKHADRKQEWLLWCLGADLFANLVAHFGINYVLELMMSFFPLLACISVATFEAKRVAVQSVEAPFEMELVAPNAEGIYLPLEESGSRRWHRLFEA
jgi:hypothetical protein